MKLEDFDYELPPRLIAQLPAHSRSSSRLLHLDGDSGALRDLRFSDVVDLIAPEDVLVLNDTRVIKARLMGRKKSGGKIELLIERVLASNEAQAQIRASHSPRPGSTIVVADATEATVLDRHGDIFHLRFDDCPDLLAFLERHGAVPLPPYIDHTPDAADETRYQTVYARERGAVAAPTAGLHFDEALLERLRERGVTIAYVTLHVGAGTFQPVRASDLSAHEMHSEWFSVPAETIAAIAAAKRAGGRVVAAGTTTLRALETAAAGSSSFDSATATLRTNGISELRAGYGETKLFILPGYRFRVVERLITNFHLPKSTLLMLVSAFGGMENVRRAYRHAIEKAYRFYSYGDAMLVERMPG